jgi:aerobic carbon-monoxide dehydrogenase large subunit
VPGLDQGFDPRDRARRRRRLRLQGHPAARGDLPRLARAAPAAPGALDRGPARAAHANANCREHHYDITLYADRDGRLLGIDCDATVDSGAYSLYPFSACLEAAQVGSILPGPYKMDRYRCRTWSVATNKPPILPYRGVARTGVCFALELLLDAVAREAGREPHEVRLANLVQPTRCRTTTSRSKHFDSGDYPEACGARSPRSTSRVARAPEARRADGRRIGVGLAVYCEQGAHGTSVYHGWGIPMVPGTSSARARLTPDGMLELRIGAHSHGQGLETTLAQVAHEVLGIDPGPGAARARRHR